MTRTKSWKMVHFLRSGDIAYLQVVFPDDMEAFYFVHSTLPLMKAMQRAIDDKREVNMEEYGQIVQSGWGTPSCDQIKNVEVQYSVSFDGLSMAS